MATKTIEKELLELENKYWDRIKEHDVEGALSMTDFPCIIAGASGTASVDRDMYTKIMQGATYKIHSFSIDDDDVKVRLLTDDVAIVAYKVRENLTVDGAPVSFEAADTSIWKRKGDKWLCAMHTESLLGDSYGRDRKKTS
jgi:hypothetical protein